MVIQTVEGRRYGKEWPVKRRPNVHGKNEEACGVVPDAKMEVTGPVEKIPVVVDADILSRRIRRIFLCDTKREIVRTHWHAEQLITLEAAVSYQYLSKGVSGHVRLQFSLGLRAPHGSGSP
jgi:hypothetical protein